MNGDIEEELYMEHPPGFEKPGKEDFVLKLKCSIYGLKQSARAWNKKAKEALKTLGIKSSEADPCLYTRKESDGSITYILLYVDDLLVARKSEAVVQQVYAHLYDHFITKDLGEVSHYLGIQIQHEEDGSF